MPRSIARFVFHETIDRRHWLGVALVIGGVVLLGQHTAASLPLFNEAFSLSKSLGVALVILGVITINSRPALASELRSAS